MRSVSEWVKTYSSKLCDTSLDLLGGEEDLANLLAKSRGSAGRTLRTAVQTENGEQACEKRGVRGALRVE
jgi:hypothetical protein